MAYRQRAQLEYRQKQDGRGRPLFARDGSPILEPAREEPPAEKPARRGRTLLIVGLALTALVLLLLVVLARTELPGAGDRYTQTWPTPYTATSCGDWSASMSEPQRFAGAAEILTQLRTETGLPATRPADSLITAFQSGITSTCALSASSALLSAASLVFQLDGAYRS